MWYLALLAILEPVRACPFPTHLARPPAGDTVLHTPPLGSRHGRGELRQFSNSLALFHEKYIWQEGVALLALGVLP